MAREGRTRGNTEGNEGITMGDRIQINRLGERFSSHTQAQPSSRRRRPIADAEALRERLSAATIEALADGGDPRLQ